MKDVYVVVATHQNDGIVILEVFEDVAEALDFEKNQNIRQVLLSDYGEKMAASYDKDEVQVTFCVRNFHLKNNNEIAFDQAMKVL